MRKRKTKKRRVARKRVSRIRRHSSRRPRVAKRSRRRARRNPAKKSVWGIVTRGGKVIALGSKAKLQAHARWVRKHFRAKVKIAKVKARKKK